MRSLGRKIPFTDRYVNSSRYLNNAPPPPLLERNGRVKPVLHAAQERIVSRRECKFHDSRNTARVSIARDCCADTYLTPNLPPRYLITSLPLSPALSRYDFEQGRVNKSLEINQMGNNIILDHLGRNPVLDVSRIIFPCDAPGLCRRNSTTVPFPVEGSRSDARGNEM
jgi:hypothetical protein